MAYMSTLTPATAVADIANQPQQSLLLFSLTMISKSPVWCTINNRLELAGILKPRCALFGPLEQVLCLLKLFVPRA